MNHNWLKITKDFLSFTLESIESGSSAKNNFIGSETLKINQLTAIFLCNGVLFFLPDKCNKKQLLILSAGIHGNETAPMELLQRWCADIFKGSLKLSIPLVLIIGNPKAAIESKRFIKENLNRLFSSDEKPKLKNLETTRANEIITHLKQLYKKYSCNDVVHFDLHTAIRQSKQEKFLVLPFKQDNSHSLPLINFWSDCGLTAALKANRPAKTFSYFTQSEFNAVSATVELGKVAAFGENDMSKFKGVDEGIRNFLSTGKWPKTTKKPRLKIFQVKLELMKTSEHFKLFIEPDFANFSGFEKGYLLASDPSVNFEFRISSDREVLIFPNNQIPVGQRAGLVAEMEN